MNRFEIQKLYKNKIISLQLELSKCNDKKTREDLQNLINYYIKELMSI